MLPLEFLRVGEWAEIAQVSGEGPCVARLAELGLRAGARLQMIQPGSPCLVRLEGGRLGLRPECAHHILVIPAAELAATEALAGTLAGASEAA